MTASKGSGDRFVLPRWRTWRRSTDSGELLPLAPTRGVPYDLGSSQGREDELIRRLDEFKHWSGVYEAADVVSTAIVLGLEESPGVKDAARLLYNSALPVGRELAERILYAPPTLRSSEIDDLESQAELNAAQSEEEERRRVTQSRKIVRRQPRNALRWADLALAHTVLGNNQAASKAMRVAVALSNGNRFILRAASRFHVHEEDLDAARDVLISDTDRFVRDPWLMAAEIAIAELAGQPLRFAKRGRRMLEADVQARHVSELAAALATAELKSGNVKQARRLFTLAVQDPTENSLAQAEWSVGQGLNVLQSVKADPTLSFEAKARHALRHGEFDVAMNQSRLWQEDQPFALDPALHLSYIASTLSEEYDIAILACERGLKTNPGNNTLLNNLAFSQASADLIGPARATMSKLVTTDDDSPRKKFTSTATRGLISFREGSVAEGRRLYRESILGWRHLPGSEDGAARAAMFWAREEIRAETEYASEALAVAEALVARASDDADIRWLHERLVRLPRKS